MPLVHGRSCRPLSAVAATLAATGAALLILIVTKGFGVARLRPATCWVLVVLVLFIYGVGPVFGIPGVDSTKRVIHLLDRSYSARPLAQRIAERFLQMKQSRSSVFAAILSSGFRFTAIVKL